MTANNDIKSFVLLKYKMITYDYNTWGFCSSYPRPVLEKWMHRCAKDVENVVKNGLGKKCIHVAKLCSKKLATKEDLDIAWSNFYRSEHESIEYYAVAAHYNAAFCYFHRDQLDVYPECAYSAAETVSTHEIKFNEYVEWLIEELCNYESEQTITN